MRSRPEVRLPEAVDVCLAVVIAGVVAAAVLRAAGSIGAWLLGVPQPAAGLEGGAAVLLDPARPDRGLSCPGLGPLVFWLVVVVLLAGAAGVVWGARRWVAAARGTGGVSVVGTASRAEVAATASTRVLLRRGRVLRPGLTRVGTREVGYRLGRACGLEVWASVEDSMLLIGPPRSGKGAHVVINVILDAPGAVVTTSTRPDNLTATLLARQRRGPVAVFDPQQLAAGVPAGLRWSPIRGCEDPLTAMVRAAGLAAGTALAAGGVDQGSFWEGKTRTVLQGLLHAAALDGRSPAELFRWTLDAAAASDAVAILAAHPEAAPGWAESLGAMTDADPRTRDSIWQGVSLALGALADPRVLEAVSPGPEEAFDPKRFLAESGTLYLLATGAGAGASSGLVAALVEDLVETARRVAARSPGARLDPPLLLALDEIGNLAPLPSLPTLTAEGGGSGITTVSVLQSLAQARHRWGEHAAAAIWDASIVKIVLGGGSNSRDLHDLATVIGDRDEQVDSRTTGDGGTTSIQRSSRRVPVMSPEAIRTLPFGTALVLLRAAPPIIVRMRSWSRRPDRRTLNADRAVVEGVLRRR